MKTHMEMLLDASRPHASRLGACAQRNTEIVAVQDRPHKVTIPQVLVHLGN